MSPSLKNYFSSFHSIVFSSCGNFLAVSDRRGNVFVHKLTNLVQQRGLNGDSLAEDSLKLKPYVTIPSETKGNSNVVRLLSWREFLLCCFPNGQVNGYAWSDIAKQRVVSSWARKFLPAKDAAAVEFDTWTTFTDHAGRELLVAGGCNGVGTHRNEVPICCWEFENANLVKSYHGHTNSVYCISTSSRSNGNDSTNTFFSAGEDGEVRLWDLRSTNSAAIMKPFDTECSRPAMGKWIQCLVNDDDWMICGGGPQLGLWHIGSHSLVKPMTTNVGNFKDVEYRRGLIVDEKIVTGGSGGNLFQWNYRGDSLAVMPASCGFVYDLQYHAKPTQKTLAAVGTGNLIDLYSNLLYRMTPIETVT